MYGGVARGRSREVFDALDELACSVALVTTGSQATTLVRYVGSGLLWLDGQVLERTYMHTFVVADTPNSYLTYLILGTGSAYDAITTGCFGSIETTRHTFCLQDSP